MVAMILLIVVAGNLLLFLAIFLLVSWIFSLISGWGRLAAVYRCGSTAGVPMMRRESVSVGPARYRRCARVAFRPEGLYVAVALLRLHPPLCIPWREFRQFEPAMFYRQPSMKITVGDPPRGTILLPMHLYQLAYPYLTAGSAAARGSA